jgi:hypothetical protein
MQYLTQRALVQLNGKHPVSSTRNQPSRSERHGDTMLVSHTPGGGPGSRRNDNRQRNKGHPSARGNNEQEVQQSTLNQRGARHHGQDPLEATFTATPRSTSDGRSMMAATRGLSLKRREGTVLAGATMTTTNPIQRTSNQLESPSTMVSRTHASGFDATPLLLKFQGIQLYKSSLLPGGSGVRAPHVA